MVGTKLKTKERFGRVPETVIEDKRLKDSDVRVYCALALTEQEGETKVGLRALAKVSTKSRSTVSRSLRL
jgi:hypothetical protein